MKNIKVILLAVVLASCANAHAYDKSFNLSISSDGKLVLQSVQLTNAKGYEKTITKGADNFTFSNVVDRYEVYSLSVTYLNPVLKKTTGTNIQLFLKAGDTKVIFQGTAGKYIVTGASTAAQKDFDALVSKDQVYLRRVMQLESKLYQYKKAGNRIAASVTKDSLSEAKNARNKNVYESFIRQHANDDLSLYAMRVYSSINMENPLEVKSILSTLGKELQETEEIAEIRKEVEENEKFMEGVKAPDFKQNDTSGTSIALSSLQGKFVLIDFWASWCKPCRAQNPSLVRLYKKYKDSGFTILGVSLDSKKESWMKAIHDDNLPWQNVSDLNSWNNAVARQYKISHVPQNYLLNPQGVIIGKNLDEDDLDQLLEKELIKSKS